MNPSSQLVENWFFQFFMWISICGSIIANYLATWISKKDPLFGRRMFAIFLPITCLATYWFCVYSLYFFDVYNRDTYRDLISPLAPFVFIIVWTMPPLAYYMDNRKRIRSSKKPKE